MTLLKKFRSAMRSLKRIDAIGERLEALHHDIQDVRNQLLPAILDQCGASLSYEHSVANRIFPRSDVSLDVDHLIGKHIPQSLLFMADIIPAIASLATFISTRPITVLDVGAGAGAGSHLLAKIFSDWFTFSVKVTALEMVPALTCFSRAAYPGMATLQADVSHLSNCEFNLVISSHVIEHIAHPRDFLKQLCRLASGYVVVYAPWEEVQLVPGHVNQINAAWLGHLGSEPLWAQVMRSPGWYGGPSEDYRTVLAIYRGTAQDKTDAKDLAIAAALDRAYERNRIESFA